MALRDYRFDPFFVSRPSTIAQRFVCLASDKVPLSIWAMALSTVQSTLWGFPTSSRSSRSRGSRSSRSSR